MNPPERRRSPRSTFIASVEITELKSRIHVRARTSDLSLLGCYADTLNPFPEGTQTLLRIVFQKESFEVEAVVVHSKPNMGMGLMFTQINAEQRAILKSWLDELDRVEEQLRLKETQG